MSRTIWKKQLTVDRRIVRLLSASTYEDFPGAIREMVSNGYDADATEIKIEISLAKDLIRISDNGNGMTPEDFDLFLRIAGRQRGRSTSPVFGRERIGQFGIGFLSAFPFGKNIHVASTARKSDIRFEASIPTEQFFGEAKGIIDVGDIPIPGFEVHDAKFLREHGTTITVSGLTEMAHRYLQEVNPKSDSPRRGRRKSNVLQGMKRLAWRLQEDLPLDYQPNEPVAQAFSDLRPAGISVTLNSKVLFRNSPGIDILESSRWKNGPVECRYVIASDWQSIANESRGLKQRIHNVGIGERTVFGLGTEGRTFSRLHWLTGEIRILKGLDNLLSIDRAKFVDSPDYDRFKEFFKERLAHFAYYVETVDVAKRELSSQLSGSRLARVEPKHEVVERNIRTLKEKGFELKSKPLSKAGRKASAVTVDLKRRTVEVIEDHPAFSEQMTIANKKFRTRYMKWDIETDFPAVRKGTDGVIEINTEYPLFKSKRYGIKPLNPSSITTSNVIVRSLVLS